MSEALERLKELTAQARQKVADGAPNDPTNADAFRELTAALREASEAVGAETHRKQQLAEGEAGDELRRELDDAQRHDERTGKVRYDGGRGIYPTVAKMAGQLEFISPLPEGQADSPLARAIHIPSADPEVRELQETHDACAMAKAFTRRAWGELPLARSILARKVEGLAQRATILSPDTTGYGAEWSPTFFSARLIEDIYIQSSILPLLERFPMSRGLAKVPQLLNDPAVYRATGATSSNDYGIPSSPVSEVTTGDVDFSAEKVQIILGLADETEEDSIFAVAPVLRRRMVAAIARGLESAVINGSTALNDLDNAAAATLWAALAGTRDVRYSWDGLRKDAVTTSARRDAGGTGQFDITDVLTAKAMMGKYGTDAARDRLVWLAGCDAEHMVLGLSQLVTVDKYGPQATVRTGEIGRLLGIPVVISGNVYGPYQGIGLNASGVYDGVTTTATVMALLNLDAYWLADRRTLRIEDERSAIGGMQFIVANWRGDFQKTMPSTAKTCTVIYNMVP